MTDEQMATTYITAEHYQRVMGELFARLDAQDKALAAWRAADERRQDEARARHEGKERARNRMGLASAALTGLLSHPDNQFSTGDRAAASYAKAAVRMADALLSELDKEPG